VVCTFGPASRCALTTADGTDATAEALAALQAHAPHVLEMAVGADVFAADASGGARGMAGRAGVPYLGDVPLDPNLLRACEEGR
jgi:hypothetical protein